MKGTLDPYTPERKTNTSAENLYEFCETSPPDPDALGFRLVVSEGFRIETPDLRTKRLRLHLYYASEDARCTNDVGPLLEVHRIDADTFASFS